VAVVIDTDVVSYFFKRDTRAALYRPHLTDPPYHDLVYDARRIAAMDAPERLGGNATEGTGNLP